MTECANCGYLNNSGLATCQSCGSKLQRHTVIEVRNSISDDYERTTVFTIVLVLQYLSAALFALIGILIFVLGVALSSEIGPGIGNDMVLIIIITLIPLGIAGLLFWLTYSLQDYNDTARQITSFLSILNIIVLIYTFSVTNVVGILIELFILYVLLVDEDTVRLFQ